MRMLALVELGVIALFANVAAKGESLNSNRQGIPLPPNAAAPAWPKPSLCQFPPNSPSLRCDKIELVHSRAALGGFEIRVDGKPMAIGQNRPMIGYVFGNEMRWLDLAEAARQKMSARKERGSLMVEFECVDADGAKWSINQRFTPGAIGSALDIRNEIICDQERSVAFLSMFMIFAGAGSFGPIKGQGLLAGLEYLENEPSSSEADIIGPASKRQVPDNLKLTFPLIAIQYEGRFLALAWKMSPHFCALYDSPDRLFGSGGHVMGVLYPGSDGKIRKEGSLLPLVTETLGAGQAVVFRATLMGGLGDSVVPAIKEYVALRRLPDLPSTLSLQQYVSSAAGGWLDSKIREGNLVRHAIAEGNFAPGPAADAAVWMDWLASRTQQQDLAARLRATSTNVLAQVRPADIDGADVGHVRYPVASLIYGHVPEAATRAGQNGRALLGKFDSDLSVKYHPHAGGPDYGKTHSSNEANGFTSRPVQDLLEAAAFSGDQELLIAAMERLRAMKKFRNSVPRGAQTWECPLHIPDILASAQMVRAYTLGYELSGDPDFLEQARYWAWTGVPFVYLVNPTSEAVGPYATIAVFGATQWKAPVWLGLPVQWCGLVYADALYRLVRDDPKGPWKQLADGITASGVQQSWPSTDRAMQGLLPDSFVLRGQHRNGPAINPATLLPSAVRFFNQAPVYDFWCLRKNGLRVHAPGLLTAIKEKNRHISFHVQGWVDHPYCVLINGLTKRPQLKINGKSTECAAPHEFQEKEGRLILKVQGNPRVELGL